MSAGNAAAGGGVGAAGERAGDAALEENLPTGPPAGSSSAAGSAAGPASGPQGAVTEMPRKRKGSTDLQDPAEVDMEDDQDKSEGEDQHVKVKCFREPHSQIEKRRRDKMNSLIDELSAMIPTCHPVSRRLDKLTVLRMAVQHLKSVRGATNSFAEASYKRSFLPDDELKHLVLRAADGFLFVVSCDRGKILFVSETVSKILNYSRTDWIGQSLFDYVHPKDMGKVKEQLSACDLHPRDRLIDTKTGLQVQADIPVGAARLCSGARRSFFCRMKYNRVVVKLEEKGFQAGSSKKKESQRYCTVHCTGYMRSWPASQLEAEVEGDVDKDGSHFSCLVAVGRVHAPMALQANGEVRVQPNVFITRCAMDGKFTFVDQRATTVLGYLPQELLGTSCYEYFHQDDLPHLADRHRKDERVLFQRYPSPFLHYLLRSKEKIETNCYKFKTKYGSFVTLQSQWFSFINPWTKEVEYIVSTNTVILGHSGAAGEKSDQPAQPKASEDDARKVFPIIPGISSGSGSMIYAGSIGTQIANELLDFNRMNSSPLSGNTSPFRMQDKSHLALAATSANVPNGELTGMEHPGKSGPDGEHRGQQFPASEAVTGDHTQLDLDSMVGPSLGTLNNDEAAMAVIMSLLETDANLGEAVDFDEMHWSL